MQAPSRSLPLTGASNFRDLGGYAGHGGRQVRWRRIFRSDHLADLTPTDVAQVTELGLTRVCDFRGTQERAPQACVLPQVKVHALSIEPTVVQGMKSLLASGQAPTVQDTVRLMEQTYRDFVLHNSVRFAELFGHLLESDAPLVFHCTAGKDRTGFAAALILTALGVPKAVVMQDYLLTNDLYRMPHTSAPFAPQEVLNVLWRVQPNFLEAAFHAVETEYGSLQHYLAKTLGMGAPEMARLETLYLQN
jgi:protein-tyrosine phosphatase